MLLTPNEQRLRELIRAYKSMAQCVYVAQPDDTLKPLAEYILGKQGLLDTGKFMALRRRYNGEVKLYKFDGKGYKKFNMQTICELERAIEDTMWKCACEKDA